MKSVACVIAVLFQRPTDVNLHYVLPVRAALEHLAQWLALARGGVDGGHEEMGRSHTGVAERHGRADGRASIQPRPSP